MSTFAEAQAAKPCCDCNSQTQLSGVENQKETMEMNLSNCVTAACLVAVSLIAMPVAEAAGVVKVLGAGSSAMWQTAAIGAYEQLAGAGAGHFTVKGTCTAGANCAQIHDSRLATIANEGGNLWIVWNSAQTIVWAYISVDSVVGNRSYFAQPRTTLQIDPMVESGVPSGQTNLISSNLWGADAATLPTAVYNLLNNATITTAFTDIRPEDAKFASCRVLNQLNSTTYAGLGYGTGTTCTTQQGTSILSSFSSTSANPVNFNISGTDPITGVAIKRYATTDVGAAPIVYVVNRTNPNGLGFGGAGTPTITDVELTGVQELYNGGLCSTKAFSGGPATAVPVSVMLREPLSGTMNTHEFTNLRLHLKPNNSQEVGVNPANPNNNPLALTCTNGGGSRHRVIGTGEMINTGVFNTADSIGYAFFSYGNVSKIAGTTSYGYLTLAGVDPIQTTYTNGELPICTSSAGSGVCPATPGSSFPNLRNGTYRSWSVLRVVVDAGTAAQVATIQLVNAIQNNVNTTVPDFVPFNAVGGDPGLRYYRSHYLQSGVAPNNGLSGEHEQGGDVGGCIEPVGPAPGVLGCHQ